MTIPPVEPSIDHTPAYDTFVANAADLLEFQAIFRRGLPTHGPIPESDAPEGSAEHGALLQTLRDRVIANAATLRGVNLGQRMVIVMTVTMVETFLQDVLAYAELHHPLRVLESEWKLKYAEIQRWGSGDALCDEMCHRWARNFVAEGEPSELVDRLETLGVRFQAAEALDPLDLMWAIRHVVVHNAGFATPEFVHLHPGRGVLGELVYVDPPEYKGWLGAVEDLVFSTERFVVGRLRTRGHSRPR